MAFAVVKDANAIATPPSPAGARGRRDEDGRQPARPVARPARVHFVTALPKTRSGKLLRRSIQALCEGRDPGDLTTIETRPRSTRCVAPSSPPEARRSMTAGETVTRRSGRGCRAIGRSDFGTGCATDCRRPGDHDAEEEHADHRRRHARDGRSDRRGEEEPLGSGDRHRRRRGHLLQFVRLDGAPPVSAYIAPRRRAPRRSAGARPRSTRT